MKTNVKKLTTAAIFSALAFAVAFACNVVPISLVPVPFLKYDAKDFIIVLCGYILSPVYALAVSLVTAVLEMLLISETGPIGMVMNFLSSAIFACTASIIYKKIHNLHGAVLGMFCSIITTTAFMLGWNYLITPYYQGMAREAVAEMLLPFFLPFNLIKSTLNAAIVLLTYKSIITVLRKAKLVKAKEESKPSVKSAVVSITIAVLLVAACVATVLILKKYIPETLWVEILEKHK